jgi:RNA polymerase sigma-70 factor (ECF subfamily)
MSGVVVRSLGADTKLRLVHGEPKGAPARESRSPISSLDDNELLEAVRSGDESASTALYHRIAPQVDATIGRLLGPRDVDVEDVAHLAFMEIVTSIHRFRGECSLDTWVSRVTAFVVCKHIRRRRLERGVFERTESEAEDRGRPGPRLVARSLLARVRGHLAEIEQGKALAFLLHDVCGFDLREAAGMLDVSVAAAQKRLVRGRREIRARLAADPELADLLVQTEGEEP